MYNFSVSMALMDFIPVALFGWAAVMLLRDLYGVLRIGGYAMFASGCIDVFAAGFLKALWKLLYAAGVCDFQSLNKLFLPLQSLGFLLAGIGIALLFLPRRKLLAVPPPVFGGTVVFIVMMVLGLGSICACLGTLAVRLGKKWAAVVFALSFLCSMGMGAMANKDVTLAIVNWIEQGINCAGQGLFLIGVLCLHKAGLRSCRA